MLAYRMFFFNLNEHDEIRDGVVQFINLGWEIPLGHKWNAFTLIGSETVHNELFVSCENCLKFKISCLYVCLFFSFQTHFRMLLRSILIFVCAVRIFIIFQGKYRNFLP